jgi:predicted amidohydrolase
MASGRYVACSITFHKINAIVGTIPERATDGRVYNTAIVFSPQGALAGLMSLIFDYKASFR